jgi:anaerobic magnesium-protoporphyrin IX monomethyl ester cyclase
MKTYLLNPTVKGQGLFIREGRCMQKTSSWVTVWPPVTLAVLGAIARKHGDVRLLDGNVEEVTMDALLEDIAAFNPDIVLINTGFPSIEGDMEVASAIKDRYSDKKLVSYGVYFTLLEDAAMRNYPFLDFGIIGEPETTFKELMERLSANNNDYSDIQGLVYKGLRGLTMNAKRDLIENLDSLPLPARDLLKNERYRLPHNGKTFTLINSARGCPFNCIYCIVTPYYGKSVRRHSIAYIMQEIRECKKTYGIEEFLFWEEVFSLDKEFVKELCDALLEEQINIRWAATTRVDTLDEETLRKMKDAGCYLLGLGIESGNQEILDAAKKKQTIEGIKQAVELCKKVKLQTMGHFIFGLPGETRQTAQKTIDFMLGLGLDYMQAYCAVPYPKTEFGRIALEKGWVSTLDWVKYDFGGDSIVNTDTMSAKETTYYRKKAFRSFYFRPMYAFKKVITNVSFQQIFKLSRFLEWMGLR